jgi:PAS domain S-box-containing protein
MKDYGSSANVVSAGQGPHTEGPSAQRSEEAPRGASGEHKADELATALAMMHATLESTTDAILVTDEANYIREFNEKYVKFWGIPSHMMISAHASELWNYISPQLKDPAGYLARVHEIIASAAPETFDVLQLKDGRVFERNSAVQLIKQRNVGRVWSFRDITRRKRAQDALANEKRVLEKIASGAPLATVLDVLVRGVEAQSCDGMMCTVLVFDEAAQCLRHGAAPGLPAEYNRIVDGIRIGPCVGSCGSAAYTREPVFATDIGSDPHWADYVELAATFGLGSCCSTPVFSSDGILLGTVAMYYRRPHEPSAHDRELIRMATHLAGIVIERARAVEQLRVAKVAAEQRAQEIEERDREIRQKNEQMETDLRMATELQQALMPSTYPTFPADAAAGATKLRFCHRYLPATLMGGDFFHIARLNEDTAAICICDVMGHGVRAALITAMMRAMIETHSVEAAEPGRLLTQLNSEFTGILKQTGTLVFVTVLYFVINIKTGTARFARAGHPPPLQVRRSSDEVQTIMMGADFAGPAIGIIRNAQFKTAEMKLAPGDFLLFYTDGIIEVEAGDGSQFGVKGLRESVRSNLDQPTESLLDAIVSDVYKFGDSTVLRDDACLVVAELSAN